MEQTEKRPLLETRQLLAFLILLGGLVVMSLLSLPATTASQVNEARITGYGWSDTIGWMSFHCADLGTCGSMPYGITIGSGGQLSGYAWSDNIGWISANPSDVSGCPDAPCAPRIQDNEMRGWFRSLAGEGSASETGNWDGWISLGGSTYGITIDDDGIFSGYGWGSDVIGWVDFSFARSDYEPCTPQYFCTDNDQYYRNRFCEESLVQSCSPLVCSFGACISPPPPEPPVTSIAANPVLVRDGETTTISWQTENTVSCTVTGDNGDSWSGTAGSETTSAIQITTVYTLSCEADDGSNPTESITVRIVPVWQEF